MRNNEHNHHLSHDCAGRRLIRQFRRYPDHSSLPIGFVLPASASLDKPLVLSRAPFYKGFTGGFL